MNKMRLLLLGTLCFISAVLNSSAFAVHRTGAVSLTLGAGDYFFSSRRHIDNTGVPFGGLGYDFTDQWGIEGLLGFFNTDSNRHADNGKQVNGVLFLIDGVYHFSPFKKAIQPFVLAGVGILGMSPNGTDARNEGNINAGIGLEFFATESVAFRIEGRDLYTINGGKNDAMLDAGVTFLFDVG